MQGHVAANCVQAILVWAALASKAYDFRLRFWDRFLGRDLNASSSKVTSLRAALQAEFWSHGNSTFWEPQCRPQSFTSFVGLFVLPSL